MQKLPVLLTRLLSDPQEVLDRLHAKGRPGWTAVALHPNLARSGLGHKSVSVLDRRWNGAVTSALAETTLQEIEAEVRSFFESRRSDQPFSLIHNADWGLARLQYAICRALMPRMVVETGVAYGISSAFILKALEVSGQRALYSIDFPPLARGRGRRGRTDVFADALAPGAGFVAEKNVRIIEADW